MNITKLLTDLRTERDRIDRAIIVLEELAGTPKRKGRPPKAVIEQQVSNAAEDPAESFKTA
jgi:hypothetical protein